MTRTVVCFKWGTMYGPEYVNTLYAMVRRNVEGAFRFVCLTDDSNGLRDEIDAQPLPDFPEPPWEYARYCSAWRKLALFDASRLGLSGRILFLDLDVVVMGSLMPFFDTNGHFKMIENWYQPGKGQASAMCFDGDTMKPLLARYLDNPIAVLDRFQTEQEYISESVDRSTAFFEARLAKSFKKHVMHQGVARFSSKAYDIPKGAHLLVFHGRPNPPDAITGDWGKEMNALKRWWKGLKPSPWIADYWRQ